MRAGPDETENRGVRAAAEAAARGECVPAGAVLSQDKMRSLRTYEPGAARGLLLAVGSEHQQREIPGGGSWRP